MSQNRLQNKAFSRCFSLVVHFMILDHVEKAVVTPSLVFRTNGPTKILIWTWTRASFLGRQ